MFSRNFLMALLQCYNCSTTIIHWKVLIFISNFLFQVKYNHMLFLLCTEQSVVRKLVCRINFIGNPTQEKLPASLTFCKIIAAKLETDVFDEWTVKLKIIWRDGCMLRVTVNSFASEWKLVVSLTGLPWDQHCLISLSMT